MLFTSQSFLFLFLPIMIAVYFALTGHRKMQNTFLLTMSLGFYAWGEPVFVLILLVSILGNWAAALCVEHFRERKKICFLVLAVMMTGNMGLLFWFKYLSFTVQIANKLFDVQWMVPEIVLPIGISFFTFQAVSYVLDVYRKDGEVQKNPLNVGLYITFFPQLIAGPIVRYQTVAEEISYRRETVDDFVYGINRFMLGFSKKVLLSNTMGSIADYAFGMAGDELSKSLAWLGAIAYTLQIFYDFSGYSDMAIGLGRMFGFHFLENFNYPYFATSITDFWRRWHISLSSWFRDYVYIPLGGSRKKKLRIIFNLLVVWALTGIWHGANMTFIVWGLFYFVLLVFEKFTPFGNMLGKHKVFGWCWSILFVIIGWVIFRAENITYALEYLKVMFLGNSGAVNIPTAAVLIKENFVFFVAAFLFSVPLKHLILKKDPKGEMSIIGRIGIFFLFGISVLYILNSTYNPFIYFNF